MTKFKRSPINYMGSKFRSLGQVIPYFPENIDNFYDVFGGSATVSLNTQAKSYYYNDKITPLTQLMNYLVSNDASTILSNVKHVIEEYDNMSEDGYLQLRKDYNIDKCPLKLYVLSQHSFNYLIRFNKSGGFNASFGKGICKLGENALEKLEGFEKHFENKQVKVENLDYEDFLNKYQHTFKKGDFLYFDPPYEITQANYNESRGFTGWGSNDAKTVLEWLDKLTESNISWGYSNVAISKGNENTELIKWLKERPNLKTFYREGHLSGVPSTRKLGTKDTEIYITNT